MAYVDATDATAEELIFERSEKVPVVVDLWAPWCGPCRTLGPIIESVIDETAGEVELVKVNTDDNPVLAQMFRVQGIPAVHAVRSSRVVASFVGAQPEAFVRDWVTGLLPTDAEREIASLIAAGDEASLRRALELEPDNGDVIVALAEQLVAGGRNDEALELLAKIPETDEARRVAALARTGAAATSADAAGGAAADLEAELDDLLERVKGDDDARQRFLDILEIMGPDDPRTAEHRRKLSRALF